MKFQDFKYERILFEDIEKDYGNYLQRLKEAQDPAAFMQIFNEINVYRGHIMTMISLCSVRHTINTADEFYDAENEYWDNTTPLIQNYETQFYDICLKCPFKEELAIPSVFFQLAENGFKSFDEKIIEELQEENRLTSEYGKLKASAQIEYAGETYNLASISAKLNDPDRDVRKNVYTAIMKYYEDHEDDFDEIYDKLVKVRDQMAKKLGYENFVELGYLRMNRLDYNAEMVSNYRRQVVEEIVPVATSLYERQAKRIGVDELKIYDEVYEFKTGNPTPKGTKDDLVEAALKMYEEMSTETGEYFKMMCERELFDLETKPNKEMGGYCTDFFDYKVPFIFSNFNGTQGDVDVLTHEAGHGFQSYLTQKTVTIPELCFPTYESCEIHSMSMEFFAHPWMELFFKEDTEKYYFYHIASALTFIPYGCLVDHFQHEVYTHPEMSKEERKATFRRLEKIYKPHTDYREFPLLEKGGYFYRQGHIFQSPFYYIDYTLAQICALQFYKRMLDEDANCWKDYLNLCKLGGTKSFLDLVSSANLISPFEDGCVKGVMDRMVLELNAIDDCAL